MGSTYLDTLPTEIQKDINDIAIARNNYDAVVALLKNLVWEQLDSCNSKRYLKTPHPNGRLGWGETEYNVVGTIHFGKTPSYKLSTWVLVATYTSPQVGPGNPPMFEGQIEVRPDHVICTPLQRINYGSSFR